MMSLDNFLGKNRQLLAELKKYPHPVFFLFRHTISSWDRNTPATSSGLGCFALLEDFLLSIAPRAIGKRECPSLIHTRLTLAGIPCMCAFVCGRSAEAAFVELSQAAEELGDIPDRFMCPIGCDIMRDPVTLPTSGQVRVALPCCIRERGHVGRSRLDACGVDSCIARMTKGSSGARWYRKSLRASQLMLSFFRCSRFCLPVSAGRCSFHLCFETPIDVYAGLRSIVSRKDGGLI